MANVDIELAQRVVKDLGRAQNAIDSTIKKLSVLTSNVMDALQQAKLSDSRTQPTLEGLADGFRSIVDTRRSFVHVHGELIDMKMTSDLNNVEIGCEPGPACPWDQATPGLRAVA